MGFPRFFVLSALYFGFFLTCFIPHINDLAGILSTESQGARCQSILLLLLSAELSRFSLRMNDECETHAFTDSACTQEVCGPEP